MNGFGAGATLWSKWLKVNSCGGDSNLGHVLPKYGC